MNVQQHQPGAATRLGFLFHRFQQSGADPLPAIRLADEKLRNVAFRPKQQEVGQPVDGDVAGNLAAFIFGDVHRVAVVGVAQLQVMGHALGGGFNWLGIKAGNPL